jgi:excisionase family DNA binding protein
MSTTTSAAGSSPAPGDDPLLTIAQLAHYFGKSERTIYNWRRKFGLPCLKIGKSVYFRLSEVLAHLKRLNGRSECPPALPPAA